MKATSSKTNHVLNNLGVARIGTLYPVLLVNTINMADEKHFIANPHQNDVLFGRGFHCREHQGTKQFQQLCKQQKAEYCSSTKHETKNIVAYRIINAISDLKPPGRFLQLVPPEEEKAAKHDDTEQDNTNNCNEHVWQELDIKTALNKVKQSLRNVSQPQTVEGDPASQPRFVLLDTSSPSPDGRQDINDVNNNSSPTHDGSHQQNGSDPSPLHLLLGAASASENPTIPQIQEKEDDGGALLDGSLALPHDSMYHKRTPEEPPNPLTVANESDYDDVSVEQLVQLLATEDAPKFTADEMRREQNSLSEEERVEILTDFFGELQVQKKKRAKRPVQDTSNATLLRELRQELERIPAEMKPCLLEAQKYANESEFSDDKFELFLRREDMVPEVCCS